MILGIKRKPDFCSSTDCADQFKFCHPLTLLNFQYLEVLQSGRLLLLICQHVAQCQPSGTLKYLPHTLTKHFEIRNAHLNP